MTHKLFALAYSKCCPESSDSPANQEVLLGGHLYLMAIKVEDDSVDSSKFTYQLILVTTMSMQQQS